MTTKQEIKTKLLNTLLFYDNEFLDKYCEFIEANRFTYWTFERSKEFQYHHILPKQISLALKQKIDNSFSNLIVLPLSLHKHAHELLNRCCKIRFVDNKRLKIGKKRAIKKARIQQPLSQRDKAQLYTILNKFFN